MDGVTKIYKAVVLAAGRGTRMRELTAEVPKPMIDVRGKPVLQHIIEGLRDAGIRETATACCHPRASCPCAPRAETDPGKLRERVPLLAGGDDRNALPRHARPEHRLAACESRRFSLTG